MLQAQKQIPDVKITGNQLFEEWKKEIRYGVKDSSYFLYESIIRNHLAPYWGNTYLSEIKEDTIQEFINQKIQERLSFSYINFIVNLLKNILHTAYRKKYISAPQFSIISPRIPTSSLNIFSLEEWNQLSSFLQIQSDNFSKGVLLCMFTGLRIGELCGLRWEDFDWESQQIQIQRTVYRIKNPNFDGFTSEQKTMLYITSPKTKHSIRTIPLPDFLVEVLNKCQEAPDHYILTGSTNCMEPRCVQKKFKKLLMQANLRYLNFHSLRHSFATRAIEKGFDYKTLSEILGHSSVNTTLNIYVHSDIDRKRQCMNLLK